MSSKEDESRWLVRTLFGVLLTGMLGVLAFMGKNQFDVAVQMGGVAAVQGVNQTRIEAVERRYDSHRDYHDTLDHFGLEDPCPKGSECFEIGIAAEREERERGGG